jgi:exodeoxyribonuclease VII small subunit
VAEAPKFEQGLAGLEKLVAELEAGDLGLDDALGRYEKGVKLAKQLQEALEASQRKVEKLAAGGLEPMDAEEAGEEPAPKKKGSKKSQDSLF